MRIVQHHVLYGGKFFGALSVVGTNWREFPDFRIRIAALRVSRLWVSRSSVRGENLRDPSLARGVRNSHPVSSVAGGTACDAEMEGYVGCSAALCI